MEQHPGDRVFVSGGGSSHGVKAVADGTMGIGTVSRDLTDSEMEAHPDLVLHAIARDGIAIVVHLENPVDGLGKIRTTVAGDKHSIGFLSLGYASSDVKTVALDGVAPTTENVRSGEYAISRTLLMITKGEPDEDEQAFLDFVLSEDGQKIVLDVHYIPVG
jgi:ABC-type phosphate transport system substrate-binding protein